jgi:DNA-binding SARP family transcriptional activator/tetratricopeptide (TPR) repeat protein
VWFKLLGPFEIEADEPVSIPRRRERCLLAVLLLEQGRGVSASRLAELLWDGDPPSSARNALSTHVSRLRAALDPGLVRIDRSGSGYVLHTDPQRIDAHRFEDLVRQARDLPVPDRAPVLRSALALWRGRLLADLGSDQLRDWLGAGLEELRLAAVELRSEADLAAGRHTELIPELQCLVSTYPSRERFIADLMLALYRSQRQTDALAVYEDSRRVLADELGLSPGPELRELHERILRTDPVLDLPERITALGREPVSPPAPRQLPHDIANFTGRDAEVAALDALVPDERTAPTIVSIDGAPGTGKTTLAVHWAHRQAARYPEAQLYLNLRGYGPGEPVGPSAAAEILLRSLGIDGEQIPPGADERSALLRSSLAGRSVLMLLDNARDADQVRPLLPGTGSLVVVTSRSQLRGLSIRDGAHRVTLRRLPADQAVELLAGAVGVERVTAEPAAAARLAELCDNLPLALAIVAERAHRAGTLAEVVEALADEHARLDQLGTGEGDPHTDLRAALSWSYQALAADAAVMFRKLGLHPGIYVDLAGAAALADVPVPRAKAALDHLATVHLVEEPRWQVYELHDLVRLYAADLAVEYESEAERDDTVRRILSWYLHLTVSADRRLLPHRRRDFVAPHEPLRPPLEFADQAAAIDWFTAEYHCLRAVASWAVEHGYAEYGWRIALAMLTFIDRTVPVAEAVAFFELVHRAVKSDGDLVGTAYTLNALGAVQLGNDDPRRAWPYLEEALALFQRLGHRRGEAMLLGNIGLAASELGEYEAARYHFAVALKLCDQLAYPRGTVLNLDNLGVMHTATSEYAQAVRCHLRADEISRTLGDPLLDAINQHHLGRAYAGLGRISLSAKAFRESVARYRHLGNRRWAAIVLTDFATMLNKANHPTLARTMWQEALTTLTDLGDHRAEEVHKALSPTPH